MRNIFFLAFLPFVASCSSLRGSFEGPVTEAQVKGAKRTFAHNLQGGDPKADRSLPFLSAEPSELMVQHHLQGCRWHQALAEIKKLPPKRQTIYLATLTSLASKEIVPKKAEKNASQGPTVWAYEAAGLEVWRDEWQELEVENLCGSRLSQLNATKRDKLRRVSREYFSKLTPEEWERDFLLVGLAFDVEAELPSEHLLQHYRQFQGTPTYERLKKNVPAKEEIAVAQSGNEIELGTISFSETIYKPKPSRVPWLVEEL